MKQIGEEIRPNPAWQNHAEAYSDGHEHESDCDDQP
jgi:hypothetical protein